MSLKPEMENLKENLKVMMMNSYFVALTFKYCIDHMKTCCYEMMKWPRKLDG